MRVTFLSVSMVGFTTAIKTGNPHPVQERGVRSDRNYFRLLATTRSVRFEILSLVDGLSIDDSAAELGDFAKVASNDAPRSNILSPFRI